MRKTEIYTCEGSDRDTGKTFLITEMAAEKSEKWAARCLNALAASGLQVPEGTGLEGLAYVGFDSFKGLPWEQTEPLLDEMFTCIQRIPDPNKKTPAYPLGYPRPLIQEDIEEVATRLELRLKILELHLGFSLADKLSSFKEMLVGASQTNTATSQGSSV